MRRVVLMALVGALGVVCGADVAAPGAKDKTRFPGAKVWGEVRVTTDRMPGAEFTIAPKGAEVSFFGYHRGYHVYDLTLGRVTREVLSDEPIHSLAYSADSELLATAEWLAGVRLRNRKTGQVLDTLQPKGVLGAFSATFLPGDKLVASCWRTAPGEPSKIREQIAVWELEGRQYGWTNPEGIEIRRRLDGATHRQVGWPVTERTEADGEMIRRRFAHFGGHLLSVHTQRKSGAVISRSATLTDPTTNKESTRVALDTDDDFIFDASPDGRTLLVSNLNRPPRLVDVATGKNTHLLTGHLQYVTCGAFSPDGKLVATASGTTRQTNLAPKVAPPPGAPTEIIIWNVTTGQKVAALRDTTKSHDFYKVGFSPDSKFLLAMTPPERPDGERRKGGEMILWGKLPARATEPPAPTQLQATELPPPPRPLPTERTPPPELPGTEPPQLPRPREGEEPFVLSDRLDRFIEGLAASSRASDQKAEALFLAILGRFPTEDERKRAIATFGKDPQVASGWRRMAEALVDTTEFRDHAEGLHKRIDPSASKAPRR